MVNFLHRYQYTTSSIQSETLAISPSRARRILDIGGGTGAFTVAMAMKCEADFVAVIDISEMAIRGRVDGVDVAEVMDIEKQGELESFVLRYGPFDLVLCLDVLEHLLDPWAVVEKLHRLLPEDAHVLASIPNVQNYRVVLRSLLGTWHYKDSGIFDRTHLRFFSRRSARMLMTGTGLILVETGRTYGAAKRDRLMSRLSFGLLDPWVTLQNLFLVKKIGSDVRPAGFFGESIEHS